MFYHIMNYQYYILINNNYQNELITCDKTVFTNKLIICDKYIIYQ